MHRGISKHRSRARSDARIADARINRLLSSFPRTVQPRGCNDITKGKLPSKDLLTLPWAKLASHRESKSAIFEPHPDFYRDHPLISATLKLTTHSDYQRALDLLNAKIRAQGVRFQDLDETMEQVSTSITRTVVRRNMLCALSHREPACAPHFRSTRRALAGWSRNLRPKEALPLAKQLACAFVGYLFLSGRAAHGIVLLLPGRHSCVPMNLCP